MSAHLKTALQVVEATGLQVSWHEGTGSKERSAARFLPFRAGSVQNMCSKAVVHVQLHMLADR